MIRAVSSTINERWITFRRFKVEGRGWRNGVRTGRLKTAEGFVEYAAPQITGREELFRSAVRERLQGRT
ncbi:MAG: hypothetical protein OXG16_02365 [Rhodospirillales bacterium]|nr:hypothetical protein [Rhodospirillales bacterium]